MAHCMRRLTATGRATTVVAVENRVGIVCSGQLLSQDSGAMHSTIAPVKKGVIIVVSPFPVG